MKTNFDYTSVPRNLIYCERQHLDDFGVEEPMTLNNCIYEALYKLFSHMPTFEELTTEMFNLAYYICTITLADSHPDRRFGTFSQLVNLRMYGESDYIGAVFSIVLLQIRTHGWDASPAIKRLTESIEQELKQKHEDSYKKVYLAVNDSITKSSDVIKLPPKSDFIPDRATCLSSEIFDDFDWCKYFGKNKVDILEFIYEIGKDEEEQIIILNYLAERMQPLFDDDSAHSTFFNQIENEIHKLNRKKDRKNEKDLTPENRIAELENENTILRSKIQQIQEDLADKTGGKGLQCSHATLFGHALVTYLGYQPKNKQTEVSPIVNQLFGYGIKSIERKIGRYDREKDKEPVSKIFKEIAPDFANHILNIDKVTKSKKQGTL